MFCASVRGFRLFFSIYSFEFFAVFFIEIFIYLLMVWGMIWLRGEVSESDATARLLGRVAIYKVGWVWGKRVGGGDDSGVSWNG